MFGSDYYKYPEVLFHSFGQMKEEYGKKSENISSNNVLTAFIKIYIKIFGIPEIGFQVRFLHFNKIISTYLKKNPTAILDAGSGIGSYTFFLHSKYPKAYILGGEIDKSKLAFSRMYVKSLKSKRVAFAYMDITKKMNAHNKYDLIVNIDVLEHIKEYKKVLHNFSKLLKPGSYVYIHTPHQNQKRIFPFSEKWHHDDHVREGFTKTGLVRDIEKTGLEVVIACKTFGPLGRFAWEVNHFLLEKSFILAGLTYPVLYIISYGDLFITDSNGWGIVILARKPKNK